MENFRSKSCIDDQRYNNNMQIEVYNSSSSQQHQQQQPTDMYDLRCYSTNSGPHNRETKINKKSKKTDFESKASSSLKSWSFKDPELQRKKRVAGYKVYAVEGKMKGSIRKSFRWIKDRYSQAVYGWW